MAIDPVASARVELELNDDALVAGLRRVEQQHERTMREIDRSHAEATVDLDTSGYDDAIKNVRREIKELQGQKATKTLDIDDKEYKRKMKALRKELADIEGQKATVELELKGEDAFHRANKRIEQATTKRLAAEEKLERDKQRLYEQNERRREILETQRVRGVRNAARVSAALNKQRERELASAHQWALKLNREMDQAAAARERDVRSIPKLQREYADLTVKLERLAAARRKAFPDRRSMVRVDLQIAETEAKMRTLVESLEKIGSDVDVRINFRSGAALGAAVRAGLKRGGLVEAGFVAGQGMGQGILRGIQETFTPANLGNRVMNTVRRLGGMLSSLSTAAIRIGPFTATLRTAMIAMTALGPTIVDVTGALLSLVGVVGTGLTGALALGAGALGAFGVSLGGIGFLIPTLLSEFKDLTKLQNAYRTAVLKFGEDSDQAKTKLEQFNHALGEVAPTTRSAFQNMHVFRDAWGRMAKDVEPEFFDAMGQGLHTVNQLMPWFAKNTHDAFRVLNRGWKEWMEGLRGDEAGKILRTLGRNGNRSLRPLMDSLGNLVTWFGRIAAESSRHLPGIMRQFRDWSQGLADSVAPGETLGSTIERLVEHTRSLGRFLVSTGRFLGSFFNASADSGENFLDVMTRVIDGWTEFNRSAEGQNKIRKFMDRAVEGTRALYNLLAPMVSTFVVWASNMSPIVTGIMEGVGAVTKLVLGFVKLVGLQDSLGTLATTLGAIWAVGRIRAAVAAVGAFSNALLGMGAAGTVAGAGGAAAGRGGGLGAMLLGVGGAGGAKRIIGPAEKRWSNILRTVGFGAVKKAGLIGAGIMAMELIGKGIQTVGAREGLKSQFLGLGQDIYSTLTLGMVKSADEQSSIAAKEVIARLRQDVDLELDKNTKLRQGKADSWWKAMLVPASQIFNDTSTLDLKLDDKKTAENFRRSLRIADEIVEQHKLPDLKPELRIKANPQDLETIRNNWRRLESNLATTTRNIQRNTDETMLAIKNSMGFNSRQGKDAVAKNMQLTAQAIMRNIERGSTSAHKGMTEIRRQFSIHSAAAARTTDINFGHAKTAIQQAVQEGRISSEKGLREIRRLWVSYLKLYGFSEKEAQNVAKGNRMDAGPEEGTRGPGRSGTRARRAGGGLINIGTPGQVGRDSVPMNLGGVPSVVAPGEQIAVFNRHQQRAVNSYLPGGLEGFFASNRRPHHMAEGGIVPVPGFPGERAHSSILDEISWVARTFGLVLTDAFGAGHKSPGHTQFGTAADFAGPDRAMDAAVRALVAQGYLVGYDGRFGSASWPGHGPAAGQGGGNAHLHVEFGGKGGVGGMAIQAQNIERQLAVQGYGAVTSAVQQVLDVVRAAAQQNLDSVAQQSLSVATAGGHGVGPGAGAATRSQMERWATMALNATRGLGHGGATAGNISKLLTLAMKESSWIVDSINNWDINAQRGNPSGGLMHVTIDKVGGSREALFDPVTNMIASIRYQMSRYGGLITHSPYAAGGLIDTMPESKWARGGKVERPTLMTGEDGKRAPEFVIGTNPSYRRNNIAALTAAANKLGVPMARKSKTGTVKPKLVRGTGKDPENLKAVKKYATIQDKEDDKRREISIAESRVREPDTLIKQQGTDALGNPLYVVDQSKIDAYVAMMNTVKKLYDDLINKIMVQLANQAKRAYSALDRYRADRTKNIHNLAAQNKINERLMKSKDEHTREAAKRRYAAGVDMRNDQIGLRNDAETVRGRIKDDQHDAGYRIQEYDIARQSVIEDINAVGSKAAADAAAETESSRTIEPGETPDTGVGSGSSPAELRTEALRTELALAEAGYGANGRLGNARPIEEIMKDLIAANEQRITEAQALLTDTDPTNDQTAYNAIIDAANAIKDLQGDVTAGIQETTNFSSAIHDLYRSFGNNFGGGFGGVSSGQQAANFMAGGGANTGIFTPASGGANTGQGIFTPASGGAGSNIHIEQHFPTQPDPMTWARATRLELNAAL